jgi:UDP-4-amino-4,6-dideoxy-N-acetyl-beta-L-altrosamine transaminase
MIPYGRQEITQEDIDAVVTVLKSVFITQGSTVPQFEQKVCKYTDAKYGVAVNSATSALHLACLALGLGKGDWLWTTPITFVASANCGIYCGAKIDFVDIDKKTYNLSPQALENKLIKAEKENKLPKIVIPVHFTGQSCEMDKICQLSQKYGFKIIEDASHAIGGKYKNRPIGNCKYSDITIFSFHPVKIITTGEGGMAVTNDHELADKMSLLRSHGITRDEKLMTQVPDGPWYYEQVDLGFNFRMTDIQAALGVSQLQRLSSYIEKRNEIAKIYNSSLKGLPITLPYQHSDSISAYHLYVICLNNEIENSHRDIFENLQKNKIGVNIHYIPVHLQPYYKNIGFKRGDYPNSERYYQQAISLPIYPTLSNKDHHYIVESLIKTLEK